MPIIDKDTMKALVGITAATYDTQITALIPVIQRWVVAYLNNAFLDNNVRMSSSTLTLNNLTPATITDSNSKFIANGDTSTYFYDGMDMEIYGTYRNDKVVNVATVTAGTLTLATGETLVDEDAESENNYVRLTRVNWDEGIQPVIADMIYWRLDKKRFMKSWSLADYSEVILGAGGYPKELLKQLTPWMKMKWG